MKKRLPPFLFAILALFLLAPPAWASHSDCCFNNGTPGCDDAECQDTVCPVDPFCCSVEWDSICVTEAEDLCGDVCLPHDVKIDLKPGSNPNCVNPESKGRVAVATYGAPDFDVSTIDPSTVVFGGASALRCSANKDVLMEGPTSVFTKDGITDLVCHFRTRDVSWPADGSDCGYLQFVAALFDGTPLVETELACLAGEPACEAEATSFGPVTEDLTPCNPNVVDTWQFAVKAGQTVVARGDTVDAATAADLKMTLTCGLQSDSGDDEVACTFPPPNFACPLATLTATSNTLCTVDFSSFPGNCTDNAIANYELSVEVDGIGVFLELVGDDQ